MAIVDYSLERFPEELTDHIELVDGFGVMAFGEFDIEAEEQAHRTNLMIAEWIEQLATSISGDPSHFMPDHICVDLHHVDTVDDVQTVKFEVGFFRFADPQFPLVPPSPFLTLYSWRVTQIGFGVIWTSLGFRCEEISAEAEEALYRRVLAAAAAALPGEP